MNTLNQLCAIVLFLAIVIDDAIGVEAIDASAELRSCIVGRELTATESIAIVDAFVSTGDLLAAARIVEAAPSSTLQTLRSICIYRSVQHKRGLQWIPKMGEDPSPWLAAIGLASNLGKYDLADTITESCLKRFPTVRNDAIHSLGRNAARNGDLKIATAAFVKSGIPENQAVRDAISISKKRNPVLNDLPSLTWRRAIKPVFTTTTIKAPRIDDRQTLDRRLDKCTTDVDEIGVWLGWGIRSCKANDLRGTRESIKAINQIGKNNHQLWRSVRPALAYLYTKAQEKRSLTTLAFFDDKFSGMENVEKPASNEGIIAGLMQLGDIETAVTVIKAAPLHLKSLVVFAEVGAGKFSVDQLIRSSRNFDESAHIIATALLVSVLEERAIDESKVSGKAPG